MLGGYGLWLFAALLSGFFGGTVARDRQPGRFWDYFALGLLAPGIGVIPAFFLQRPMPAPQPPGWYADPWDPSGARYYDGTEWTWQTDPETAASS